LLLLFAEALRRLPVFYTDFHVNLFSGDEINTMGLLSGLHTVELAGGLLAVIKCSGTVGRLPAAALPEIAGFAISAIGKRLLHTIGRKGTGSAFYLLLKRCL
jgi:hypothetical protein